MTSAIAFVFTERAKALLHRKVLHHEVHKVRPPANTTRINSCQSGDLLVGKGGKTGFVAGLATVLSLATLSSSEVQGLRQASTCW